VSSPELLAVELGAIALAGAGIAPMLRTRPAADVWFSVQWPRDVDPTAVVGLLRQFSAASRPRTLVLELRAVDGHISFRLGVPERDAQLLPKLFRGWMPDVLLEPAQRDRDSWAHAVELRLPNRQRPLRTDEPQAVSHTVLSALAAVGSGTTIVQYVLGPRLTPRFVAHDTPAQVTGWRSVADALVVGDRPLDAHARTALRNKVGDHGVRIAVRIGTTIPDRRIALGVLHRVTGSFRVAEGPGARFQLRRIGAGALEAPMVPWRWRIAVNVPELVGLLAWPLADTRAPGVTRVASRRLPIPRPVPAQGRVVGDGNHPATLRPVAQHGRDTMMHWHVLGPTGVGKSTLLANMVLQDIAAGRGAVVVEPKGDLVADILARIPKSRRDDVVVLDPTDDRAVVGVNPLRGGPPDLAADQIMAVFRGLYGDYLGPRTADVLHAALLTLARTPDATLVGLPWLLGDARYRRTVTRGVRDDLGLGPFWAWYEGLSDAERNQVIAPVMNKVRPFLLRERLRRVLGQPRPRFDLAQVFRERKILLVPLSKGILGSETASLLGSLVVSGLWQAAQTRSAIPPERRHGITVVIDEFQDFLHLPTDLADVLAQARGLGLGLVLAHQHLGQLSASMRAAVLANARSRACFRLSNDDAAILARTTDLLDATDFQSLGRYEIYTSLVADGASQPYCSATTRPLDTPSTNQAQVRRASRDQYGTPFAEIDTELQASIDADAPPDGGGPIGTQRRPAR
jgi:hypothetical protein